MTCWRYDSGRIIDSPLAYLMNTAFYLQGTFFLVGAVLVARAVESQKAGTGSQPREPRRPPETFRLGPFTADPSQRSNGTAWVQFAGAVMVIAGGNMAILAGSAIVRNAGAAQWYRGASLGIAVLGC